MNFYIQACNPRTLCTADSNDKTLADAIENAFPLKTEDAILIWNHISIPLSYKYDISYMMDDILMLLNMLQSREKGELTIHWLPDTFRCDWIVRWMADRLDIQSKWGNTVGNLQILLNEKSRISLKKEDFIKEWKSILHVVITGLIKCGYTVDRIKNMKQLIAQYGNINGSGILYNE